MPSQIVRPGDQVFVLYATKVGVMHKAHGEVYVRPGKGTNLLNVNNRHKLPKASSIDSGLSLLMD